MEIRKPHPKKWIPSSLILAFGCLAIASSCVGILVATIFLPEHTERFPGESPEDHMCPAYGCPIYPLEKNSSEVQKAMRLMDESYSGMLGRRLQQRQQRRRQKLPPFARSTGATVTYQSNQHAFNQDRAFLIRPFHTHQTDRKTSGNNQAYDYSSSLNFLIAILDGHGVDGHLVAEYVQHELPRRLAVQLDDKPCCQTDEWIKQQFKDTFIKVNEDIPPTNALRGGCTASVALKMGDNKLVIANAGDSRTLLIKAKTSLIPSSFDKPFRDDDEAVQILYETRRDKPNLPDEKERIEGLGGRIHIPPQNANLSRVVVHSKTAGEDVALAMSRSLGDWEWKNIGVTAEPIVDVIDLANITAKLDEDEVLFVLAASDGLFDLRKDIFLAKQFARSFGQYPRKSNLLKDAVEVIERVLKPQKPEWYRDDITVIVLPI